MSLIIEQPEHLNGRIEAVRVRSNGKTAGKCAIVWTFRSREVWIDERPEAGPKRALYEYLKGIPAADWKKILRLEADAEHVLFTERTQERTQTFPHEVAEAMATFVEGNEHFIIESDPYVTA